MRQPTGWLNSCSPSTLWVTGLKDNDMSSLAIAFTLFACVLLSTLISMAVARRLPDHHVSGEFRDVVKLGLGVIGTLTAMVLGLLVAASKGTYDAQSGTVKEVAAQLGVLDRVLARYGPETAEIRGQLRVLTQSVLDQFWPQDSATSIDFNGGQSRNVGETIFDAISELSPRTDSQRLFKSRAQDVILGLIQFRQRLVANSERSIPSALLIALAVWQAVLFAGFGLLAPRNATTIVILAVCMLSVSSALFLIMELDRPFGGMIRISDAPLRSVMSHFGE